MSRIAICLVCAAAVLAACSKTPQSAASSAPAAARPSAALLPFQRPRLRVGLWRMNVSTDAGPGLTFSGETCIDQSTERSAFEANPRSHSTDCSEPKFAANPGGGVAFEETCKLNQRTVTTHGVASGDFSSSYVVDVTSRLDPPLPGGMGNGHSRIEAHWQGPCKPGQRPGQMSNVHLSGVGRG